MLCYCIQIEFTSLVRIKTLCLLYLLSVVLGSLLLFGFVFPREFSSLFRVSRGQFVLLRGTSAAWRHRESSPLLCSAVVAPWCYGIGTVLDFINGWFSRWESSGPARVGGRSFAEFQRCSSHVQESQRVIREEGVLRLARCFKQSNLALPAGGLSNPIVRMGRSPPHVQAFWGWNLRGPTFQSFRGRYKLTDFICLFSHTWC